MSAIIGTATCGPGGYGTVPSVHCSNLPAAGFDIGWILALGVALLAVGIKLRPQRQ